MLDEAPDSLIYSAIEGFETQPDIASLERIEQTQSKTALLRSQRIANLESQVKQLEEELKAVQSALDGLSIPSSAISETLRGFGAKTSGASEQDETDVFKLINLKSLSLDNEKVALAKQLTEIESSINQMNMAKIKATRRREEVNDLREQALALNVANNYNGTSMKISLFKKFGVHIEEKEGGSDRIVIFDHGSNLTNVLEVDDKYLDYFISNYIWDRLGNVA